MVVRFIGQGYNPPIGTSVAQELMNGFSDPSYSSFKCLVAFASKAGVSALTPFVQNSKRYIDNFIVIVGIDQGGTSKEALLELMGWDIGASIFYTTQRVIFHPKIYIFSGLTKSLVIIGSNNMTQTGLVQNIEGSIAIEFDNTETEHDFLHQVNNYFNKIFAGEETNCQLITEDLIDRLVRSGLIPNEEQRRSSYTKKVTAAQNRPEDNLSDIFGQIAIQKLPEGFNPIQKTKTNSSVESLNSNEENTSNNNFEVLVAKLSGPTRWAQANFDVDTFENFFGASRGDNNYFISLTHITSDGRREGPFQIQAVSVKSQNYRFELSAASGRSYPIGDKPIAVFIRTDSQSFLYHLIMPDYPIYGEVNTFLMNQWGNRAVNRIPRIRTDINTIMTECPNLPF